MSNSKLIITGGAGFIGANIIKTLNDAGLINDIIIVDYLLDDAKRKNLGILKYDKYFDRDEFLLAIKSDNFFDIKAIIHMGACSDTTEDDKDFILQTNYEYSKHLFNYCVKKDIQFIYASSAATYGDGSRGFDDNIFELEPLNLYGQSKHLFDLWVLAQKVRPPQWVGLKFFNVYGPYEYHKGRMASVVLNGFKQIVQTNEIKLFKSYNKEYSNGGQLRDFIYVKDVVKVVLYFLKNPNVNGIFNVGTGKSRSFSDLAKAIFSALEKETKIKFIEMPEDLKDKYQYYTKAEINLLRDAGYHDKFWELEDGVRDYVLNYLKKIF